MPTKVRSTPDLLDQDCTMSGPDLYNRPNSVPEDEELGLKEQGKCGEKRACKDYEWN